MPDTSEKKVKKKSGADLSKLDSESIEIMAMLMLYCSKNQLTINEVFEDVIFLQNIKGKKRQQTIEIMKASDFYRVLNDCQIRIGEEPHLNLQSFLQLSAGYPDLITLKAMKKTLESME